MTRRGCGDGGTCVVPAGASTTRPQVRSTWTTTDTRPSASRSVRDDDDGSPELSDQRRSPSTTSTRPLISPTTARSTRAARRRSPSATSPILRPPTGRGLPLRLFVQQCQSGDRHVCAERQRRARPPVRIPTVLRPHTVRARIIDKDGGFRSTRPSRRSTTSARREASPVLELPTSSSPRTTSRPRPGPSTFPFRVF